MNIQFVVFLPGEKYDVTDDRIIIYVFPSDKVEILMTPNARRFFRDESRKFYGGRANVKRFFADILLDNVEGWAVEIQKG